MQFHQLTQLKSNRILGDLTFCDLTFVTELSWSRGEYRDFGKGGGAWTRKYYFTRYEEAIKNALKWKKTDLSSFTSKKVVANLFWVS